MQVELVASRRKSLMRFQAVCKYDVLLMNSIDHANGISPFISPPRPSGTSAQSLVNVNNAASSQTDRGRGSEGQHVQNALDQTSHRDGPQATTTPTDVWSAAYREAVDSLGKDIDVAILRGSGAAQLFKQLEEIDKNVSRDSAFLRGVACLRSIQVPLEKFKLALDLASPLGNLEPIAGTVFGVVKGVTAVSWPTMSPQLRRRTLCDTDSFWERRLL